MRTLDQLTLYSSLIHSSATWITKQQKNTANNFDGLLETHIAILLKKKTKIQISRLEIHKIINSLLKEEFNKGLHSLQIRIN